MEALSISVAFETAQEMDDLSFVLSITVTSALLWRRLRGNVLAVRILFVSAQARMVH